MSLTKNKVTTGPEHHAELSCCLNIRIGSADTTPHGHKAMGTPFPPGSALFLGWRVLGENVGWHLESKDSSPGEQSVPGPAGRLFKMQFISATKVRFATQCLHGLSPLLVTCASHLPRLPQRNITHRLL